MADSISSPSLCLLVYFSDHSDQGKIDLDRLRLLSARDDLIGHISGATMMLMISEILPGDGSVQTDSQYGYASLRETIISYPTGDHLTMMSSTVRIRVSPRKPLLLELRLLYLRVRDPDNISTENTLEMIDSRI